MDMEWNVDARSSGLSLEEAREAAKEIFSASNASFEEIKNRPWYKNLLNAVTFRQGDKKLIVRSVRSLAGLQSLFMEVYAAQIKSLDAELDDIMRQIFQTQEFAYKLYRACVLNLTPQEDVGSLTEEDQQILLLLLGEFDRTRCLAEAERERLQQYNRSIAKALCVQRPDGSLNLKLLEQVQAPAVFYRCLLEQCAVTGRLEPLRFPENVEEAAEWLDISGRKKAEALTAVKTELDEYGKDFFFEKYQRTGPVLDEHDFIFAGDEPEEAEEPEEPEETNVPEENGESQTPMERLAASIRLRSQNKWLGVPQLTGKDEAKKNELIAELLPSVLPVSKTVLEITKLKNGHLVFTSCAMYWSAQGTVYRIPYVKITGSCIGTRTTKDGNAFVYTPAREPQVEILSPELNTAQLEQMLLEISKAGEFAESDTLTSFPDFPLALQLSYMRILAGVVREGGWPLHEVFRIAVRYGLEDYWEDISQGPKLPLAEAIRAFNASIPYPNEEALAISLLQDVCTAYQYTKDSDVLTAEEKTYFPLIYADSSSHIENIIRYAQMEKQLLESRIDAKSAQEITEAFSIVAGAVGASVLAYAGSMALFISTLWFNFIPGLGTLISAGIAGAAIVNKFVSSKRDQQVSEAETRQKMRVEIMESYKSAEHTAEDRGLSEFAALLQQNAVAIAGRINYRYAAYTSSEEEALDKIRDAIISFINTEKEKKFSAKLAEDLSEEDRQKLISQITFSSSRENPDDIIGVYTALLDSFSGILFLRDSFYYRKSKSAPVQQMFYGDILRVEWKALSIVVHGRNENSMTFNAFAYNNADIAPLLQKIIAISRESGENACLE